MTQETRESCTVSKLETSIRNSRIPERDVPVSPDKVPELDPFFEDNGDILALVPAPFASFDTLVKDSETTLDIFPLIG